MLKNEVMLLDELEDCLKTRRRVSWCLVLVLPTLGTAGFMWWLFFLREPLDEGLGVGDFAALISASVSAIAAWPYGRLVQGRERLVTIHSVLVSAMNERQGRVPAQTARSAWQNLMTENSAG